MSGRAVASSVTFLSRVASWRAGRYPTYSTVPEHRHPRTLGGVRTRSVARAQGTNYLRKAAEHMANAHAATAAENWDTAVLLAVHAAISAADAATVTYGEVRSTSPTHTDQVRLIRALFHSTEPAENAARALAAVLDRKHGVEYEARRCTARDAEAAIKHAERVLQWAQTVCHS
ncbi:MAG: HEPN domain-containing protein [bacterium]